MPPSRGGSDEEEATIWTTRFVDGARGGGGGAGGGGGRGGRGEAGADSSDPSAGARESLGDAGVLTADAGSADGQRETWLQCDSWLGLGLG